MPVLNDVQHIDGKIMGTTEEGDSVSLCNAILRCAVQDFKMGVAYGAAIQDAKGNMHNQLKIIARQSPHYFQIGMPVNAGNAAAVPYLIYQESNL